MNADITVTITYLEFLLKTMLKPRFGLVSKAGKVSSVPLTFFQHIKVGQMPEIEAQY